MTYAACPAIATAAAVAAPWAVRRFVQGRIAVSLAAAGWTVDEFRVRRFTLREAEIAGIRISRGVTLFAGGLRASYSPWRLLGGQLDQVSIDQARVIVDITDGWDALGGELRALFQEADGARAVAVADVRLRPLTFVVVRGTGQWAVRFDEAMLTANENGRRIVAISEGREGGVHVDAGSDGRTGGSTFHAEMPARRATELLRVIGVLDGVGCKAVGRVRCDLEGAGPTAAPSGILAWSGSTTLRTDAFEFVVQDLRLEARAIAGGDGGVEAVAGLLRIAEFQVQGVRVHELEARFHADADEVEGSLSFRDAPWNVCSLRAVISELMAPEHGTPGPTGVHAPSAGITIPVEMVVESPALKRADLAFLAGSLGISGRLRRQEGSWTLPRAEMTLNRGEIRHAPMGVLCDGLHGVMLLREDGSLEGRVTADSMHLGSCVMPPLELTVSGAADGFTGRLAWKRDDAEVFSFAGAWQAGTPPFNGSLDLTSAAWPSRRNDPILACLRDRTGWDVGKGRLVTHARVRRDDLAMASRGRVLMQDLSLAWGDLRIEGLAGEVEIDDLLEGVAAPSQRVTIRRLVLPRAELGSGEMLFGIDPGWRWTPASFACLWGDGRISADSFDVDAADGHARATVEISGVQLSDVMRVLFGDGVTGEGRLDGRLPVSIRWLPNPGLTLGEGSVAASGAGRIRIRDPGIARRWAAQARGAGGGPLADDLRERLAVSLSDFEYSMLRLTLRPGPGGRPAGELDMAGKGAGSRGLPLRFTVRVAVQPPLE